jgi:iron complex transport system ATP-binding protein
MLDITAVSVAYDEKTIIHEVSLSIQPGEIVALVGPNGAGKSTLLKAISGVIPAVRGQIHVGDQQVRDLSDAKRARLLAVVPQARSLPPHFTVYQTVLLGRTPYLGWLGTTSPIDEEAIDTALTLANIRALKDRWVGTLSGGEQQRVLLARALAQDTPVLLLDEPTTHLDFRHQTELLSLIRELATTKKIAVLMVLHDLSHAGMYGDRVALMVKGEIKAFGPPHQVLTPENLSPVFHVPITVIPHPDTQTPLIIPDGNIYNKAD